LLDAKFNIKVADWSFAVKLERNKPLTKILGTHEYMAPELISKKKYFGQSVDIYSMGVVLFALMTGIQPIHEMAHINDVLYKHLANKNY